MLQLALLQHLESCSRDADQLVDCGVKSILNFAPVLLKNIPDVQIRSVDLSQELQILSYYLDRPVLKAVK